MNKLIIALPVVAVGVTLLVAAPAMASIISVPAESALGLAGQSQPALSNLWTPEANFALRNMDTYNAPASKFYNDGADWAGILREGSLPEANRTASSTIPLFLDVSGFGSTISITATGKWRKGGFQTLFGPDGNIAGGNGINKQEYDNFGISRVISTRASLLGVFLTDAAPSGGAPVTLTRGVSDMTNPELQQTFVIGSSLDNITIPGGATRLFFGFHNGSGWWNNDGDMEVKVIPAPGAALLGMMGLGLVGWVKRRRRA